MNKFEQSYFIFITFTFGDDIWDVVENGPYVPKMVINNVQQEKVKGSRNDDDDDDKKKVIFNQKAKNMLQSTLVLRSLTKAWQPKVTAVSKKKSLSNLFFAALFGKN